MLIRTQIWLALLLGSLFFGLCNTAVLSGWLKPPAGTEPLFLIRSHDMAEYATYMALASDPSLVMPELHAPWTLPGGIFHPLMIVSGGMGRLLRLSPALTFQATSFLFCLAGAWALLYAMSFFLPTVRQRWWAFGAVVAAVPLTLLGIVIKPLLPFPIEFYGLGMIEFAYNSADGLFRGGLSNGFTIAFGTVTMLLALTFTAKRIVTGARRFRYLAALVMFLSALFHPFEFFVMLPASTVALLWAAKSSGKWREAVGDCVWNTCAAIVGVLPALFLTFRYPWISDLSTIFSERMYPTWLLTMYGVPCILVVYCLLLRYRPATPSDQVLVIWFVSTAVIVCIPYCPYPPHLLDGFTYVTAMLLIRLLFEHRQTRALYQRRPRLVLALSSGVLALSVISLFFLHLELWKDGRSSNPGMLLSAVTTTDERGIAEWMRGKVSQEDLVLAPPDVAPWLTLVPMHAFGSHVLRSFTYARQLEEANAFYKGESPETARDLIQAYGVRWVVVPASSAATRYFDRPPSVEIGTLRVYEIPGNRMKPYPGLAQLLPEVANSRSLSRVVVQLWSRLWPKRPA